MSQEDNFEDLRTGNKREPDRSEARSFTKKHKGCPVCFTNHPDIDYKDPEFLSNFISEGGRILPGRITGVCSKHQRNIKKVIRLSRIIALLPFVYKSR